MYTKFSDYNISIYNICFGKPSNLKVAGYNKATDCFSKYLTVLLKCIIFNLSCRGWYTISIRAIIGYLSSKMTIVFKYMGLCQQIC